MKPKIFEENKDTKIAKSITKKMELNVEYKTDGTK
jgi:hypothetical protein